MRVIKVAIIGAPNAGKSTLINNILQDKVCIVSSKAHTTQYVTLGVKNIDDCQIVFIDTPGISYGTKKTFLKLSKEAKDGAKSADLVVLIIDSTKKIPPHLVELAKNLPNKIIAFNKIDKINKSRLLPLTMEMKDISKNIFYISALTGELVNEFLQYIIYQSQENNWIYDSKFVTNRNNNELIMDRIQEVLFEKLHDEIPYQLDIMIDNYEEKANKIRIDASIIGRQAYKHIIVSKIKELSIAMRENLSYFLKKKVDFFLNFKSRS